MFGSIFIDSDEADKSISKTEKKAEGLASKLGGGIKTAAKWGAAIAGGATVAAGGMLAMANKSAEATDRIDKMSQKLGMTRQGFQEWDYILSQNGASIDSMKAGMKTLTSQFDMLTKGGKNATEAFDALGLSQKDLAGLSQEEIFEKTIVALQGMEDETQRAALANQLLGKAGQELAPVLNSGAGSVEELKKQAKDLGLVISDEAVDAGVLWTDTVDNLKRSFGAMTTNIGASVMPIVQKFADLIIDNMPLVQDVFNKVVNAISPLVEQVLPVFLELFTYIIENILPVFLDLFNQVLEDVLPVLIDLFMFIVENILPIFNQLLEVVVQDILPIFITLFTEVISEVLPPLMELFEIIINDILPVFIDLFTDVLAAVLPALIDIILALLPVITDLIMLFTDIVEVVVPPLIEIIEFLADIITTVLQNSFEDLMPIIENIINIFNNLIDFIKNVFTGNWKDAWGNVVEIFKNIFKGIVNIAKLPLNTMIGLINGFIKGLNKIKIPDWVPGVGGKGINIPEIPKLADGGEILQTGKAIVGEMGPELLELPKGAKVKPLDKTGGDTVISGNNFYIREESDIKKVARELKKLQDTKRGGVAFA